MSAALGDRNLSSANIVSRLRSSSRKKRLSDASLFDDEAESRLLGACLLDNTLVAHCKELHAEDFAGTIYREAWRVIVEWDQAGVPFDEEMLARGLRDQGLSIDSSVISEWMTNSLPDAQRCRRRADRIAGLSRRRQLARNLERAQGDIYDLTISETAIAERILGDARAALEDRAGCARRLEYAAAGTVDGAKVAGDSETFLRQFFVLAEPYFAILPVWVLHTHVFESFDYTPYLSITSPTKRCAKSNLCSALGVLEPVS